MLNSYENGDKHIVVQADLTEVQRNQHRAYVDKCHTEIREAVLLKKKHETDLSEIQAKIRDRQFDLQKVYTKKVDDMGSELAGLRAQRDQLHAAIEDAKHQLADLAHQQQIVTESLHHSQKQIDAKWEELNEQVRRFHQASSDLVKETQILAEAKTKFDQDKKDQDHKIARQQSELDSRMSIVISREIALNNLPRRRI